MSSDCLTDRLLIDMIKTCGKGKEATFWSVVGFGDVLFLVQDLMVAVSRCGRGRTIYTAAANGVSTDLVEYKHIL